MLAKEFRTSREAKQLVCLSVRIGTTMLASGILLASPAVAGCLGHPQDNFCYTVDASFQHNTEQGFSDVDIHSGATPQTASTVMRDQGWASSSADSAHNGTLRVTTVLNDSDYYSATASASLKYTFRLSSIGPIVPSDTVVPLRVIASAFSLASQHPMAGEHATFEIDQDGMRVAFASERLINDRETILFSFDQWINVKPNDDLVVKMEAQSSIYSNGGIGRFTSGVLLDPVFEIGSDYAARYTLVGLPLDSQPASGVPEPASWLLIVGGFGSVGWAVRRRRLAAQGRPASADVWLPSI